MHASASLAGFRAFEARTHHTDELSDGAAELVGVSLVSEGVIARGKALLIEALKTEAITAFGATTPDGSMETIQAVEWSRPFGVHKRRGADCLTSPELPWPIRYFDLMLDAASVFRLWPFPNDPALPVVTAKRHPSNLEEVDAPLVQMMHQMITNGDATGPYNAALAVVDSAQGAGTVESKVRRLERRYSAIYG